MIKDYYELSLRKELESRFEEYKKDWKYKGQIQIGSFIPEIEIYEKEIDLLLRMCDHSILLNKFQEKNKLEIESLRGFLESKKIAFEFASQNEKVESRYTMLEREEQLDTILFVLSQSRIEISPFGTTKGQISLGL